jgi:hypothetical protein
VSSTQSFGSDSLLASSLLDGSLWLMAQGWESFRNPASGPPFDSTVVSDYVQVTIRYTLP